MLDQRAIPYVTLSLPPGVIHHLHLHMFIISSTPHSHFSRVSHWDTIPTADFVIHSIRFHYYFDRHYTIDTICLRSLARLTSNLSSNQRNAHAYTTTTLPPHLSASHLTISLATMLTNTAFPLLR